jgi:hypothetical protein
LIVHPTITGSVRVLDAAGVRWCVLRGVAQLRGLEATSIARATRGIVD